MATSKQILDLIQAYSSHDDEKFKTIVLQIAAHEAKLGHGSIAQELKQKAVSIGKKPSVVSINPNHSFILDYSMPSQKLSELVVEDKVEAKIKRILVEFRNRKKLHNCGLTNRRKILLEGCPGTGKTLTASIVASELGLPLYTVQVDKLVTKFMGETSIRLRQVFENMAVYTGVYFFDEFDAIGADRLLDNEVGEMRRILNSFLQFLESDSSESIIIAATNNQRILDKALFRRFDDVLHYDLPNDKQIRKLISFKLINYNGEEVCDNEVVHAAKGLSQAEISLVCDDVIKDSILYESDVSKNSIIYLLNERHRIYQTKEA